MKDLKEKLKNLKKKHFLGFTGLVILLIGLFWRYSISNQSRTIASDTDCNDIEIFQEDLELSACELEEKIDETLHSLSDVKITHFRYGYIIGFLKTISEPFYREFKKAIHGKLDFHANKTVVFHGGERRIEFICAVNSDEAQNEHSVIIDFKCYNKDFNTDLTNEFIKHKFKLEFPLSIKK
ncbi:MAG: hypothetical protein OXB84_06050 [Halobacteriovoraceae bacterium]|nr:hypothetical protein [Halobacteriovoraceae bacterium]